MGSVPLRARAGSSAKRRLTGNCLGVGLLLKWSKVGSKVFRWNKMDHVDSSRPRQLVNPRSGQLPFNFRSFLASAVRHC